MIKHNIYITGFMGTGKSAVGRVVAQKIGKIFIDTDRAIKDRQGRSIADIFENWGENHFRQLETNLLKELAQRDDLVVATGGGTLLSRENVRLLDEGSIIICLFADPMVIHKRIKKNNMRPLLEHGDRLKTIKNLMKKRDSFYKQFDWQVDTSDLTVEEAADEILNILEKREHLWKIS